MLKENLHIHSSYSWDSKLEIKKTVEIARKASFDIVAITDHVELDETILSIILKYSHLSSRYNEIEDLKQDLVILHGLEISEPHLRTRDLIMLKDLPIDIILESIHDINKKEKEEEKIIQAYKTYYTKVKQSVEAGNFDVLAHLGYIDKYYNYNFKEKELIDEILKEIIKKEIALEINTSGLRRKTNPTFPKIEIIERYKELGGKKVTIGSDAHRESEIDDNIDLAYDIAKELKLEIGTFKRRKWKKIN